MILQDADIVERWLPNIYAQVVISADQTKMAKVVITLKVMPDSPNADLNKIENSVIKEIEKFAGKTEIKKELEPVAFGLKSLKMIFVCDENKSNLEELENNISSISHVNSVKIIDVRRAIG